MKIGEIATHQVPTIRRSASIVEAARMMREHHAGEVVLVEEKGSERVPVGLITERDLVSAIAQGVPHLANLLAGHFAAREVPVVEADEDVEEVARKMHALGIRRVPVVNALGALVGIASYDDLVAWMADELADFARFSKRSAQ